jgi:hypothetical protein
LDYVDFVTDFSVLRIAARTEGFFDLDDTADQTQSEVQFGRVSPSELWSTAVPLPQHYLQSLEDKTQIAAEVTGYDELEIGSTFIIS